MPRIHDPDLDLNLLKVFDAVMQTRSASRAAALLGVGQSAVSHALARLREATGDPLFIRSGGRMEPTARAQRLAEPLREALMLAAGALSADLDAPFDPASARRVFTLGAGDYAATVLLGGLVEEIAREGWDVRIAVLPVDRNSAADMLDAGRIDLALGLLPPMRRWQERAVLFEEVQACVYDGQRLGLGAPITLGRLCRAAAPGPLAARRVPDLRGRGAGGGRAVAAEHHGDGAFPVAAAAAAAGAGGGHAAAPALHGLRQRRLADRQPAAGAGAALRYLDAVAPAGQRIARASLAAREDRGAQPGAAGRRVSGAGGLSYISTRSSRWMISSRPRQPSRASSASLRWPAMRAASAAS
jgi:DNA-binding transcriptional LysR family regulator